MLCKKFLFFSHSPSYSEILGPGIPCPPTSLILFSRATRTAITILCCCVPMCRTAPAAQRMTSPLLTSCFSTASLHKPPTDCGEQPRTLAPRSALSDALCPSVYTIDTAFLLEGPATGDGCHTFCFKTRPPVVQAAPKLAIQPRMTLNQPLAPTFGVLGLQVCTTTPSFMECWEL